MNFASWSGPIIGTNDIQFAHLNQFKLPDNLYLSNVISVVSLPKLDGSHLLGLLKGTRLNESATTTYQGTSKGEIVCFDSFFHLFSYLLVHLFIHLFIHSLIHLLLYEK